MRGFKCFYLLINSIWLLRLITNFIIINLLLVMAINNFDFYSNKLMYLLFKYSVVWCQYILYELFINIVLVIMGCCVDYYTYVFDKKINLGCLLSLIFIIYTVWSLYVAVIIE